MGGLVHPSRYQPNRASRGPVRRRSTLFAAASAGVLLSTVLLSACAPSPNELANQRKAQLDAELTKASTTLNVPPSLLNPIKTHEAQIAKGVTASDASYQRASTGYSQLYTQVVAIEHMPPAQARTQTQNEIATFSTAVDGVKSQGFVEAAQYEDHLTSARQLLDAAKTLKDYFTLDTYVEQQTSAVHALMPTYQQLTAVDTLVTQQNTAMDPASAQPQPLQCASGASDQYWIDDPTVMVQPQSSTTSTAAAAAPLTTQWHDQNVSLLRAASTAKEYDALQTVLDAQSSQLAADATLQLPSQATQLLQQFTTDVQTYTQNGGTDGTYQQQLTSDQQLAKTSTLAGYASFVHTLQQQEQALQLPLLKVKTQHDMTTLKNLLAQGQAKTTVDPANGQAYPDAYEYADGSTGIGDAQARLSNAQTLDDYQQVDREILMFSNNLSAMLQNLNDATPANQPHQTDTTLLQYYGIQSAKVVVVSLREQEARFYDNGKLVQAYQVTTGAPDLPSVAGLHCVLDKATHTTFTSPDPPGSPNYYQPTPINYAMEYSHYGYFLHDAWWRAWFGKYSNLPHYDPSAFNGGSHGCINFPLNDAAWVYNWTVVGTPVVVY